MEEPRPVSFGNTQSQRPGEKLNVVPADRGRARERALSAGVAMDAALLARLAERVDGFAATLSSQEQTALHTLLHRAAGCAPVTALASEPVENVLDRDEAALYARLADEPPPVTGCMRARLVIVMKATRLCNLRCTYCHFWRDGQNQVMTFPVLARATRDALRALGVRSVEFVWHGGEATLLPLSFYRKALWLQEQFREPHQTVQNALQTNGTRLTDEWIDFCRRYGFSLGVSLDGPPEVHDSRRVDVALRPTAARVRGALVRLRDTGIDHGVLVVVDDEIIDAGAARLLDHLLEIEVTDVGLLNAVPRNTRVGAPLSGTYLPWDRYVTFLRELFRLWWPAHIDRIIFRELADLVGKIRGGSSQTCFFAGDCVGAFITIDPNGDISACDKYIDDEAFRFGNVMHMNLGELAVSPKLVAARAENSAAVDRTRDCRWFTVCQGACPHDRYIRDRHVPGYDQGCCGLGPLLADMEEAVSEAGGSIDRITGGTRGHKGSVTPSRHMG